MVLSPTSVQEKNDSGYLSAMKKIYVDTLVFQKIGDCIFTADVDAQNYTHENTYYPVLGNNAGIYTYDIKLPCDDDYSSKYDIILRKGEIIIKRGGRRGALVKCLSPFNEFITVLTKLASFETCERDTRTNLNIIRGLSPVVFKDSFN